jgi:alkylation response protein AidB-like acyl-CoA dehydrogenase
MLKPVSEHSEAAAAFEFDEKAGRQALIAATELQPLLRAHASEGDIQRFPGPEVIEALDQADLWALAVPKRLGGKGVSATAFVRVSAALAKGDPSAAWVFQIINGTTWVTSLASDALQDDLFADGAPKIAGAFNPPGTALPVEGGYRVTGAWPYASGIRHAKWAQGGIKIVHPDGNVVMGNFCYIPTDEMELKDSWFVTGLQGTGSDTMVAEDVFVPEHRIVHAAKSYNHVEPGKRNYGAPSDYFAQMALVHRTMTGVALGAAEALAEHVAQAATEKPYVGTFFARQADSQALAKSLGEAAIKIDTARLLIETATGALDEAALERRTLTERERARNKAQANYAIQILDEAVSALMFIAGSGAFNHSNPAVRYWRDFNMVARHFGNIPAVGMEVYGRSLLGVTPNAVPPFMY